MTEEKKAIWYWNFIAALIAFMVGINVGLRQYKNEPPDTITLHQTDTLTIYEPELVEIVRHDTVFDTVEVVRDYFTRKHYAFDFADSISFGKVLLQISENKAEKVVIENHVVKEQPKAKPTAALYLGAAADFGQSADIAPSCFYTHGRNLFGVGYAINSKQVRLSYGFKLF